MDYNALKTELLSGHPITGAYNSNSVIAATQINDKNVTSNKLSISGDDIFNATVNTEFIALTSEKKTLWLSFCGRSIINPFNSANVAFVTWIFGGGSATVAALAGVRTETISRAVALGFGTVLAGDIEYARSI